MIPMRFVELDQLEVAPLLTDDRWVAEQKMDGTRGLFIIEGGRLVTVLGSRGGPLKHSAATQWIKAIERDLAPFIGQVDGKAILDAEIMLDGDLRVFDMPYLRLGGIEFVRTTDPLRVRRERLESVSDTFQGRVSLVRQARSSRDKHALLAAVEAAGGEGLIMKRLDGPYEAAKRVKHTVKVKFVKTADVIVTEVNKPDPQHGSAKFAVLDESGALLPTGACSLIGKPHVAVGDVIEVAYLYRADGGRVVQPRMVRTRPDREAASCTTDQFPRYSREVV